jgi:hypothetical protein
MRRRVRAGRAAGGYDIDMQAPARAASGSIAIASLS